MNIKALGLVVSNERNLKVFILKIYFLPRYETDWNH